MNRNMFRRLILVFTSFLLALPCIAQTYPEKPITLVVTFPAGGTLDAQARMIASGLAKSLGQNVVVENVPGAGGLIGAQRAVRAKADGYTLLFGTINDVVLAPIINSNAGYSLRDLAPIIQVSSTEAVLVAHPSLQANTVDELVAFAKQKPGAVSMGHPGLGTFQHVIGMAFEKAAGVSFNGVPYKGGAPLMNDLVAGHVQLAVVSLPGASPSLAAGKIKAIALMGHRRDASHRNIPSINESATAKGLRGELWVGLFAPKATPASVLQRLHEATAQLLRSRDVRDAQTKQGSNTPEPSDIASFANFVEREDAQYRRTTAGLKLE